MKQKTIGGAIVLASAAVLVLLIFLKVTTDQRMLTACEESCSALGNDVCTIESCPYHQGGDLSWILLLMGIFVAFLGATGIYLLQPWKKAIIEEKQYDLTPLSEEEKNIFLAIQEHPEGIYQSSLAEKFQLSKVQMTRLLDKLEGLGLIERKRRGMTNIIIQK